MRVAHGRSEAHINDRGLLEATPKAAWRSSAAWANAPLSAPERMRVSVPSPAWRGVWNPAGFMREITAKLVM